MPGFERETSALWVGPPLDRTPRVALHAAAATDGPVIAVATGAAAFDALAEGPPSLTRRIAAIGCTGEEQGGDDDAFAHVETVASPADLTGLSIVLSQSLSGVRENRRPTVVVDSLTTMALFQEFDRLTRFVRQLIAEVTGRDGALVATVESGTLEDEEMATLGALFDRRIETDGHGEFRRRGSDGTTTDWRSLPALPGIDTGTGAGTGDASTDADADGRTSGGGRSSAPPPDSLADLVERVTGEGPTLTLCNVDDSEDLDAVRSYFRRLNVAVRTATLSTTAPGDVALLHRDEELVAASPLPAVRAAVETVDHDGGRSIRPAVVERTAHDVFGADGADRRTLVRASRTVERLVLRRGEGTLHAGFQSLSNLTADRGTRRIYDALADAGVDLHLYGAPDADLPEWPTATVHGTAAPELADAWFVACDAADPAGAGALVALERSPGEYDGYWTYCPERAAAVVEYLEDMYTATAPPSGPGAR